MDLEQLFAEQERMMSEYLALIEHSRLKLEELSKIQAKIEGVMEQDRIDFEEMVSRQQEMIQEDE